MTRMFLLGIAAILCGACDDGAATLTVDVKTDYRPGLEFDAIEWTLYREGSPRELIDEGRVSFAATDADRPERTTEVYVLIHREVPYGAYSVEMTMMDGPFVVPLRRVRTGDSGTLIGDVQGILPFVISRPGDSVHSFEILYDHLLCLPDHCGPRLCEGKRCSLTNQTCVDGECICDGHDASGVETECADHIDNDCDGWTDCQDIDCEHEVCSIERLAPGKKAPPYQRCCSSRDENGVLERYRDGELVNGACVNITEDERHCGFCNSECRGANPYCRNLGSALHHAACFCPRIAPPPGERYCPVFGPGTVLTCHREDERWCGCTSTEQCIQGDTSSGVRCVGRSSSSPKVCAYPEETE